MWEWHHSNALTVQQIDKDNEFSGMQNNQVIN